eukprot:TRINITY_DN2053_c0_g1_i1.p1 TRINITY_DN2053_c0_g1~~TRINITY_DN2053_c0_g1_i1.p1  ORF type:complete len:154 (+),score=28.67 TRINITY_DN2053_c0_g1_i1:97-558(+)
MVSKLAVCCLLLLCVGLVSCYQVKIVNNVSPCAGRQYCTLKVFTSNSQTNVCQGDSFTVDSSQIGWTGVGIQENGMYCHSQPDPGCSNPDNAGMQVVIKNNNCLDIDLNDPFYCGAHPPNAKTIVDVFPSGQFPNCVLTIQRKSSAPGCAYSC